MSTRRALRLTLTYLVLGGLVYLLPLVWSWWADLHPWERASAALILSAVVLTVWGVACCLREHRWEQNRG